MPEIQKALQTVPSTVCLSIPGRNSPSPKEDALQVGDTLLGVGAWRLPRDPAEVRQPRCLPCKEGQAGRERGLRLSAISQKHSSPGPEMKHPNFLAREPKVLSDPIHLLGWGT